MRIHSRSAAVILTALMLAALAAPATAATANHGELNAVANAEVDGVTATDHDNASWSGGAFTGLATNVKALAQSGALTVATHGDATATWTSANEGGVTFTDYGWDVDAPHTLDAGSDLRIDRGGPDWSYTFTALGDGAFTMDYSVTGAGQLFGLQGWEIGFTGVGAGGPILDPLDPAASGTFVGQLVAGQQYTVTLNGHPNITGGGVYAGAMSGQFDWRITEPTVGGGGGSAPEPAAWALLLIGFGATGALLRRRRVASRPAGAVQG